jgi:diguanylate cyclase (GGDEF)-like protein
MNAHVESLSHEQAIEARLKELSGRDLQLWLIGFLVLLVMASGVIALVLPNLFENLGTLRAEGRYLPQLFLGLIAVVVLFNTYLLEQRRALNIARQELVRQMLLNERAEHATLVDPLTQLFNRRYLEQVLPKEISRARRQGSTLTMLLIDLDRFKQINDGFGHLAGDELLVEVAQLLQRTFRGSDTVVRYGGDEFLVILPDTTEPEAQPAMERLLSEVGGWNAKNRRGYELSLSCGAAHFEDQDRIEDVLQRADERMYRHKQRPHEMSAATA